VSSVTNQDILGSLSVTAGISYVIDATAPTVSVTSPLTGSTLSGGSVVPIAITASDNSTVSSVDVYIDGTLKSTLTTAPYSYNWSTTGLTLASHTILAKANDPYGNTGSSAVISVTLVDQIAPTVSITSPSAASTATGSVTINATSTDNVGGTGVNRVEFYVDGTLKSTDLTSPYSYVWDSKTVLDGAHTLTAKSYDNAATPNNADHQAPTTPGGLTSSGNTLTAINLSWTASTDNIGVTGYRIQRNGTLMATVTTLAYSDTALASGSTFTYTVSAIDAANNASAPATLSATTLSIKIGDLNGDNIVNITDLSIFLSHWNTTDPVSDIDHNGIVNIFDLSSLLSHYGL
jgi:hypothetical protein